MSIVHKLLVELSTEFAGGDSLIILAILPLFDNYFKLGNDYVN